MNGETPMDCNYFALHYRNELLKHVIPFWVKRTADCDCGGYFTCFDACGKLTDKTKYVWFQGRQLWMFSALYNEVEPNERWMALAKTGRDFLVQHAYAGEGRWLYELTRDGQPIKGTISIYTDLFVLGGLCEYALARDSDEDRELVEDTYAALERNVPDAEFKDLFHGTWDPRFDRHGVYMITLCKAAIAAKVLGERRTRELTDYCLDKILYTFANDEHRALFESVGRDGRPILDAPEGRLLNPGHALESMWICMEEGMRLDDKKIVERAIRIVDWMYDRGYDREYGGIFSFVDLNESIPIQTDWHRETGLAPTDKAWWVHSESLYALALASMYDGSKQRFARFKNLHEWCHKHLRDPHYGEWYPELYRDGCPKLRDFGTLWKAAYHLPRAQLRLMRLFERQDLFPGNR